MFVLVKVMPLTKISQYTLSDPHWRDSEMSNLICQRHHEVVKIVLDGKTLAQNKINRKNIPSSLVNIRVPKVLSSFRVNTNAVHFYSKIK